MKLQKLLPIFLLFISAPFLFAQDKPQAVMINKAVKANCEDLKIYTQSFAIEIYNEPQAQGIIVIRPEKKSLNQAIWHEKIFNYQTYKMERIKIIRAAPQDDYRIEFWKAPAGADTPDFKAADWNNTQLDFSKPVLYGSEDELNICPTFIPDLYADLLKQNPNLRGRIVIYQSTESMRYSRQPQLDNWVKPLTETQKLPRNRFKLIFAKSKEGLDYVEYWIVPVKKIRRS